MRLDYFEEKVQHYLRGIELSWVSSIIIVLGILGIIIYVLMDGEFIIK